MQGIGTLNFGDGEAADADRAFVLHARTDVPALVAEIRRLRARTLTESEYNSAWHAVEGAAGEEGADPGTVLHAVLDRLGITVPGAEEQQGERPEFTDDYTAWMQIGTTPSLQGLRAELRIDGYPPLVGRYAGAGMRKAEGHDAVMLIEPLLLFPHGPAPAAEEQPAIAVSEACGKCKRPFDPADTAFDGRARYHLTPYCRGCVDLCHDTEIADHRCVICA
ncbi:hypothetical protein ACFVYV_43375 [Streptomyces mirabilis]|uniref:hypothetical protein n=1 Tax=Streptomyces mirabilis TaxID=68239 RepID=UPI0036D76DA8